MDHHLVARAVRGTLLFRTHAEARELWGCVTRRVAGMHALCLMPDHLHLVHPADVRERLGRALQSYARIRNRLRGERGSVVERSPAAQPIADAQKLNRSIRYVHLNPCRAHLVSDPLAWPWSTHRDRVGLALRPVVQRSKDPHGFHRYVSGDPHVDPRGTALPIGSAPPDVDLHTLADAVSAALRAPLPDLRARTPARRLFVRAARVLTSGADPLV